MKNFRNRCQPPRLLLPLLMLWQLLHSHALLAQQVPDAAELPLEQVLRQMETNWPQLRQYDYQLQAAEARVAGARSWMAPTANFGLSRMPYNPKMVDMPIMENQSGLMIAVEQMLPNPAKQRARERYLKAQVQPIRQQRAWTLNELRAETRQLYYSRYLAEQMLKVLQKSESVLSLLIESSEEKYPYNQAKLNNIYSARARLEELRNQRLQQQQMILESNIGLNTLMGRSTGFAFAVDTLSIPVQSNPAALVADTTTARSDIAALESTIQVMQANRELMRAELKPDFGVRFEHMPMFNMEPMYSVMAMVTIPFAPWASKMNKAEVRAMELDIQAMQQEKQTMQLMQKRMVNEKQSLQQLERERLQKYRTQVLPAYRKALDVNLLAYRQNTASLFEVLEAWEMWQMKEMEYYQLLDKALNLEVDYARELER